MMKYVKMTEYIFSTDFTRVFIVSSEESYAEVAGEAIPDGCEEITEAEFLAVIKSLENEESKVEETVNNEQD